jgi:rRNA processing protein Krr1/Pno1
VANQVITIGQTTEEEVALETMIVIANTMVINHTNTVATITQTEKAAINKITINMCINNRSPPKTSNLRTSTRRSRKEPENNLMLQLNNNSRNTQLVQRSLKRISNSRDHQGKKKSRKV